MEGRWRKWMMIMGIHGIGIIIFTRGFLLTRTELPYYSHCSDISQSPCSSPSFNASVNLNQQQCWTKPAVDRLIIIVLDALRFDFVAPSSFFPEKKPWMDKLSVLQKLAFKEGSSARIFKAIADPPTTSLQRLKGLTTGGLPTFIDVGNSFGAPAIIEDNFIHQLVINGKRTLMMGDDTWVQLFPHHFNKSFPYPSFNVKDLHTVDNGCIDHLFPSLSQDDWDVLIAHFLGVDHAGHIFGVDSVPMIEKLEQYNLILEKLIEELESQSGPGGLHENTLLVVMGDHGQTLNGDHGGGSAEEVETSIFAMSFKQPPFSIPSELDSSSCVQDLEAKKMCTSSIQQLDFAVTVSALLGVSFPFGSIGRVNPELYALGSGTWNLEETKIENRKSQSNLEDWVQNYVNVLCVNSWQVKRYIDVYSASSMIGFSSEDLLHLSNMYNLAEENWSNMKDLLSYKNESCHSILPGLTRQIDAYFNFLSNVSELARSKWTEFNLKMMGIGLGVMLMSLLIMFLAIQPSNKPYAVFLPSPGDFKISSVFAFFIVAIRASSLFSNSFILEEGKVASFLLATTGIVKLRHSIMRKKMLFEAIIFLLLVSILRLCIEVELSKQAATSSFMSASPSWMLGIAQGHPIWMYLSEFAPLLAIILLAGLLYRTTYSSYCWGVWKYVIVGTVSSYILIAVHWGSESSIPILALLLQGVGKSYIPRLVYAIGLGQLTLVAFSPVFTEEKSLDGKWSLIMKTVAILSAWSSTIILLSGKQGSLIALASIVGGYCIAKLQLVEDDANSNIATNLNFSPLAVTQWNLLAVCLFFATGHWCAFDGLRYGAAFVGFDEFILIRQAILLTIDTYGFSLILPIFGLPLLAIHHSFSGQTNYRNNSVFSELYQMYMMFGLITATTVTATIICVTIQRRHLMVWGLFAPKFVFDVVSLLLTDLLIFFALLFYPSRAQNDSQKRI